jgi:hypothetical protein
MNVLRIIALTALLAACATPQRVLRIEPASLGEHLVQQQITVIAGSQTATFEAFVEVDRHTIRFVAMNLGVRVLSFNYDGRALVVSENKLPEQLHAEQILNDLLLIFADREALAYALPPGHRLEESTQMNNTVRTVYSKGAPITEIRYQGASAWTSQITLTHRSAPYALVIDSVSLQ